MAEEGIFFKKGKRASEQKKNSRRKESVKLTPNQEHKATENVTSKAKQSVSNADWKYSSEGQAIGAHTASDYKAQK